MRQDMLFSSSKQVSNTLLQSSTVNIHSIVKSELATNLALHIIRNNLETSEHTHYTDFRLELIVCTVEEFFKEVRRYAEAECHKHPLIMGEKL
jgi:hypothetical protein